MTNKMVRATRSLITKLGKTVVLRTRVPVEYSPSTGSSIGGSYQGPTPVKAAIISAQKSKFNLEVLQGDLSITIRADKYVPTMLTECSINGTEYKTIEINEVYCYETLCLFEIQLRRKGA